MSEARDYLQKAPWIIVFNGLALFLVVTVFQLFGDRLSEFVHKKEARTENEIQDETTCNAKRRTDDSIKKIV